jgi:hypothetical protein
VRGIVRDRDTREPIAGADVVAELCGLRSENPNPALGHPNYRYGTVSDERGRFELTVPRGKLGLHALLPGYQCGILEWAAPSSGGSAIIDMTPHAANEAVAALTDLRIEPPQTQPGAPIRISVTARSAQDPLSEEVWVLEPSTQFARALTPPLRGNPAVGFPNGIWRTDAHAPAQPGIYMYSASAVTQRGCFASSRRVKVALRVDAP